MAFWIELHCDIRAADTKSWRDDRLRPFCDTNAGEIVGMLFANVGSTAKKIAILKERARKLGYTYKRGRGWACPNCNTTLKQPDGE